MHEIKACPCCNKYFECKLGSITICQCMEVRISAETRNLLTEQYNDCLCKECLKNVEQYAILKREAE